ncbi:MAG: thermonuclease family protein [Deltaproteobacteria bacterium]|nr:thermonuclease family protein [Deltaproteobacteria bacterium]MBI3755679.1 thermonuclease family protein [Deltaproteobacteria bacterium]
MVTLSLRNAFFIILAAILNNAIPPAVQAGQSSERTTKGNNTQHSRAVAVIDGDTIEIKGGIRIRYLGVDTPEIGQPFYEEAKNKNKELVLGKTVRLEICKAEPTDKYGRILAYVYTDQTFVNRTLLREGYARILIIPPCGDDKEEEFRRYQKEAMEKKIGLWSKKKKKIITKDFIPASDAARFIDERKAIYGRVIAVQEGRKALFLEIGNSIKTGLRGVIFKQDVKNFEDDGINPLSYYRGKEVVVYGKIKMYKGSPEIVIGSPSQIEAWQ